jgi:hypothetical protein
MLKSAVEALDLHFPKVTTNQRAELGAALHAREGEVMGHSRCALTLPAR